jgi:hypothetical protein
MSKEKTAKAGHTPPETEAMPTHEIESLISRPESEMQEFASMEETDTDLTGKDRQRLISARVRNNGFIDKAFDIAHDNPEFMPPHFDIDKLYENERRFEQLRQLMLVLQQFQQLATNAFMVQADFCYREALRIYGSLREQAKGKVPGAEALFQALRNFFNRRRRTGEEPTEHELELDFKRLIHGKADGEIIIENEAPHVTSGVHKVIDNVHSGRSAFKGSVEESVDEGKK